MANEPTKAELQTLLTDATNRATKAEERVAALTTDLTSANERADQERKGREDAEKRATVLETANRDLANSLKAFKGSATKARNEATMLKREKSPVARPIGRMKPLRDDEPTGDPRAALDAAFSGPLEIVASDGKKEIRELEPIAVAGDAWRVTPRGRVLQLEPVLEPGAIQRPELRIAGFGLLNEAGEQVGWCELPEPIVVKGGQKMVVPKNSIAF